MHSVPKKLVLIGASTGGPNQIERIVRSLPKLHNTSFIIAQHMVDGFIPSFAQRLQDDHKNRIVVVESEQSFERSNIYLCTGITNVEKQNGRYIFKHLSSPLNRYNPDINHIFNSTLGLLEYSKIMCVILTGIGDDGVEAAKALSIAGARCITENEHSAIVDGMPSRARAVVPNIEICAMDDIVRNIEEFCE